MASLGLGEDPQQDGAELDTVVVDTDTSVDAPLEPALVSLVWQDARIDSPSEESIAGTTALRVTNRAGRRIDVELNLVADGGTMLSTTRSLGTFSLAMGESTDVQIDIRKLGIGIAGMRMSGQLKASARVFLDDKEAYQQQTGSRAVYFHPRGQEIAIYSQKLLTNRFNAGNYRAYESPESFSPRDLETDEDGEPTVTDRILWGGGESPPAPDFSVFRGPERMDESEQESGLTIENSRTQGGGLDATRATYTLCALYQIETTDSGYKNSKNIREDHWWFVNSPISVRAHGGVVKVGNSTFTTGTSTGCVTFSKLTATHSVRIYAKAYDANDNYVRIHNASPTTTSSYPGSTHSILIEDVTFSPGVTKYVYAGSFTPRWTAMATLAFSLYRYHDGVYDSEFHIAESPDSFPPDQDAECNNRNYAKDVANNEMYIRIADDSCQTIGLDRKFLVSHEFGHALGYLHAERNSTANGNRNHAETPNACGTGGTDSYTMTSKEWSVIGAREGWAHFVAARVWNNASSDGTFRWSGATYDLERWNANNDARGRLRNVCCTGSGCANSLDGAATNQDWMNAYWDLDTNSSCSPNPSRRDMLRFWSEIITATPDEDEFYDESLNAIDTLVSNGDIGSCYGSSGSAKWENFACHNGIDFTGTVPSGGC